MTDLTDRMRTCAAHIDQLMSHNKHAGDLITVQPELVIDAGVLLREAADALEKFVVEPAQKAVEAQLEQLGEPMEIIEPVTKADVRDARDILHRVVDRTLGNNDEAYRDPGPPAEMPTRISRSCPKCGSRANKTVHAKARLLECPACGYEWPYLLEGKWV